MKITGIIACDIRGGISKNGTLPWPKNSKDLNHFKNITKNHKVIMGSGTWNDPIFPKPLPNRTNIVISSKNIVGPDYVFSGNFWDEIERISTDDEEVFIIGGKNLLENNFNYIDKIHLTIFNNDYDCDLFVDFYYFFEKYNFCIIEEEHHEELSFYTLEKGNGKILGN